MEDVWKDLLTRGKEEEEEETSLCCICDTRPASSAFSAPWIGTICSGHRCVDFCEECFLSWVYDVTEQGLPSSFSSLREDAYCPKCRQKVFPKKIDTKIYEVAFDSFKSMTPEPYLFFLLNHLNMSVSRINVFLMKLYPEKRFSKLLYKKLATDNEEVEKRLKDLTVKEARINALLPFARFFEMLSLFQDRFGHGTFFDHLFINLIEKANLFKIFSLKEMRDVLTDEVKQNLEDASSHQHRYIVETFINLMKYKMQNAFPDHPIFEGMFLHLGERGDFFVVQMQEDGTTPLILY